MSARRAGFLKRFESLDKADLGQQDCTASVVWRNTESVFAFREASVSCVTSLSTPVFNLKENGRWRRVANDVGS